jgi:carboxymethylenebutenolidase
MTTTTENAVPVGTSRMVIFIAAPDGAGPHPAVVVAHHREGIDEFTRRVATRLAENGFLAAAPNLYHRRPDDEDRMESRNFLDDIETIADLNATVACLQADKSVGAQRIGIIGHCMGGRTAFLGAATNPAFKCAGIFYGGSILAPRQNTFPAPSTLAKDIKCPLMGFFGREDKNPSPEDVERISAELKRFDIRHDFRVYDGAGHAFQNFMNKNSYREQQSEEAWSRLVPFLHAELDRR